MITVPEGTNLGRITWITNDKSKPNKFIICPVCHGIIMFNSEEILRRKAAGQTTSTPCRANGIEDWHPSFPPEPWYDYDGKGFQVANSERKIEMGGDIFKQ